MEAESELSVHPVSAAKAPQQRPLQSSKCTQHAVRVADYPIPLEQPGLRKEQLTEGLGQEVPEMAQNILLGPQLPKTGCGAEGTGGRSKGVCQLNQDNLNRKRIDVMDTHEIYKEAEKIKNSL